MKTKQPKTKKPELCVCPTCKGKKDYDKQIKKWNKEGVYSYGCNHGMYLYRVNAFVPFKTHANKHVKGPINEKRESLLDTL